MWTYSLIIDPLQELIISPIAAISGLKDRMEQYNSRDVSVTEAEDGTLIIDITSNDGNLYVANVH